MHVIGMQAMSFATVMVHVDTLDPSVARIQLAADLADQFQTRLIGVAGRAARPAVIEGGVVIDVAINEHELQDIAAQLQKRGEEFRTAVGKTRKEVEWRFAVDFPVDVVAREARAADLVVIGRDRAPGDLYASLDTAGLLLRAGRPVLVVPPGINSLTASRVVVGWKDTPEARRVLRDALPFLQQAKEVILVEVCETGTESDAKAHLDDIDAYLLRHKAIVARKVITHTKATAADELVRIAADEGANLIVAGAYGHSRLGEWIFGGVTRALLASSPVCCLFSH